jgi:uncharacterized membrane protein YgcG
MAESNKAADENDAEAGRQRSRVAFPYMDLKAALDVASAIHSNVGTSDCSLQQLSAWMDQSIKSSGFRVQLATARLFGLIESQGVDAYRLTPLGQRVVDPEQARKAKVDAFLNVPLFSILYEKYSQGVLPPAAALEREIAAVGVADKQKDRARQIFDRSAEQAGFFEHGKNRLVKPAVRQERGDGEGYGDGRGGGSGGGDANFGGGGGGSDGLNLDDLLMASLKMIPKKGEEWPAAKRLRWFKAFAMNVSQVYDDDETPVEIEMKLSDATEVREMAK